jgi:death-on-curing protein
LIQFLSLDEVLAIHAHLLAEFGGEEGVRDLGLLESALYRPQTGYYQDLTEMAAALFESLLINHPFLDGNKRVAFFATDVFLRLNGWRFRVEAQRAHEFLARRLSAGQADFGNLLSWIRSSVEKLP